MLLQPDLIAGNFIDYTAMSMMIQLQLRFNCNDTVVFVFIQNTHATTSVYINIAAGTAAAAAANITYVGPGHKLGLVDLHLHTSSYKSSCYYHLILAMREMLPITVLVAALLDDVA